MAVQYQFNLVDVSRDREPSVATTVKRIVVGVIDMFFDQSHESVRNACVNTFIQLMECCFIDKRYGPDNKRAKDLVF